MSALTDSQKTALQGLTNGAGNIPAVHAGKLIEAGYVEKTGEGSGRRGYANVQLTNAGRAVIS